MAVASDDLPRFSLLTGASGVYARAESDEIDDRLVRCLSGAFTCEAWLQIRTVSSNNQGGCWWIHAPSWACGVASDRRVVVYCHDEWFVSVFSPCEPRRWFHIAVSCHDKRNELWIDGEPVLLGPLKDPEDRLCLPVSPTAGFRIGWTPTPASPTSLVLHEVRIWSIYISNEVIQRWRSTNVSHEHPNVRQLCAHWSFSSGAGTLPEYDLSSGFSHTLVIENASARQWLQAAPPHLRRSDEPTVARLVTLQDVVSQYEKGNSRFDVEIEVLPQLDVTTSVFDAVTVVLLLNFVCYPSPSLTSKGKGAGLLHSLERFVDQLPNRFRLAIYDTSSVVNGTPCLALACTRLDDDGKARARKALDKIVVKKPTEPNDLIELIVASARDVDLNEEPHHTLITIISVTESSLCEADQALLDAVESLQSRRLTVTVSMVQVGPPEAEQAKISPLVSLFAHCEADFEWVLASIVARVREVVLAGAELVMEAVGGASFYFTPDSSPVFHRFVGQNPQTRVKTPVGYCSRFDRLCLAGVAQLAATSETEPPCITLALVYVTWDGRTHVSRATLRSFPDTTNHYHIEFTRRNERLRISDDETQLFEQRRALVRKKETFVSEFVAQEIANAENAFKQVNIMKEDLWARKKWIAGRGLRVFEELELEHLEREAAEARTAFAYRTEAVQGTFAASSRGSDSRGGSRGKPNASAALNRVRLDQQTESKDVEGHVNDDVDHESNEQWLHKVCVKLSVHTKSLAEHEAKMEDLFVSVRLAETKGSVIMNDIRRSWVLRFHDMMKTKGEVTAMTLSKEDLERKLQFLEDQQTTRQEVEAEVQVLNSLLARFEKELPKRRKRALLCAKEIVGSIIDEFEASERVEAAKRDVARSRLMRTLTLTPDMYASCIYVSFPIDISQLDVPAPQSARNFTNLVHGVCSALRHVCDASSETPVCRRLSFGETFLWWGLEQQPRAPTSDAIPATHAEGRCAVQDASWATVIVSYNALFSSGLAMAEVKTAVTAARDQTKPVFHIQLEVPYDGLDMFRSHWMGRNTHAAVVPSVEREFLTWKQNLTSFVALLGSVNSVETWKFPGAVGRCTHILSLSPTSEEWSYPCLECLWSALSSSHEAMAQPSVEGYGPWFHDLVSRIGSWFDGISSVSLQAAPRSYHIDTSAVSVLSCAWETALADQVQLLTARWNEACGRRTKEIQRQVGKLFKVYEEEARDLVGLRFKLFTRKQDVLHNMRAKLSELVDERKLLETWLEKLEYGENESDSGRQCQENETMTSEELWQQIHESERAMLFLEALDDQPESAPEDEVAAAKATLDTALRCSTRAILELGRSHIEDCFRSTMRMLKKKDLANQIEIAQARCHEQQDQIVRMERAFGEAERIYDAMHQQRDAFVLEDAKAFFSSSFLEVRTLSSTTTHEIDQDQLRKLANDGDFHATFTAAIMTQVLQAQVASSTGAAFRANVNDAVSAFIALYSPTIGPIDGYDVPSGATTARFKEYCQFCADEPATTWASLLDMQSLMDKEALEDREVQRVWGQWKKNFLDSLASFHTQRWWRQCGQMLRATHERLDEVKADLSEAFEQRCTSEREFHLAVADRERIGHRLVLLQRRLLETKQRQQTLLVLVHMARQCYETSTDVMDRKLQNVKTDAMFKSWARISEYHVGHVGSLFNWRSQCSHQVDRLEAEIQTCQQELSACDAIITIKRQEWLKHSIADHIACAKADGHVQLAHSTLELILSLEKQRVFKMFRVLDPRNVWLTLPTLIAWHERHMEAYQRELALRKAGGMQPPVGRSGVDDLLVQLSIARLDVIKQQKMRDTLQRKLQVFERILDQQVELRQVSRCGIIGEAGHECAKLCMRQQIVEDEAQIYRSLGLQLTERVAYLRDQCDASNQSDYLRMDTEDSAVPISSIDRRSAVIAVRESREQILTMIASAQQDYLRLEAMTCRIGWRMREHIACEHHGRRAIVTLKAELSHVEQYLQVLTAKDKELFNLGLQSEKTALGLGSIPDRAPTTDAMGMNMEVGRAVFDYYARDQWFRTCLDQTTALGERIKSLREVVASLVAIQQPASRPTSAEDEGTGTNPVDDKPDHADDEQLILVQRELRNAELRLLLNRFESRCAEKSSEYLKEAIDKRCEGGEDIALITSDSGRRDLDAVFAIHRVQSRMFSRNIYMDGREHLLALLRELATGFDPRDVAGNLSEVIFGASLDRNDLFLVFSLQSKAHIDEQWRVAIVVLFFARLFRRASLKKAAIQRCAHAAVLTNEKLVAAQERQLAVQTFMTLFRSPEQLAPKSPTHWINELLESVMINSPGGASIGQLQRVALGILMHQPLHRALAWLMPDTAALTSSIADGLEAERARAEYQPPKPTLLHVFMKDKHAIKIEWKPIAMDRDLVYVAEISEHAIDSASTTSKRFWMQFLTTEKTTHTFYNLHPNHAYWTRVRSGFTRTRLGAPTFPLLVTTAHENESQPLE